MTKTAEAIRKTGCDAVFVLSVLDAQGHKKDHSFLFSLNGKSLSLDFENMIRRFE